MQVACILSDATDDPAMIPVTRARHGGRVWQRFRDYGFARARTELPLALAEIDAVAASFPILFRATSDGPVAVIALDPANRGRVAVVGPDGCWCAPYVPAALRAWPFDMLCGSDGIPVLSVDETSGLVSAEPPGLAFFDADGELAAELRQVRGFLRMRMASERAARQAARALADAGLLAPGASGMLGLDDAALRRLDPDALDRLWRNGALRLAMAQRISLHHMGWLSQAGAPRAGPPDPDLPPGVGGFLSALARACTEEER